jgi:hypothetical protein
MTWPQAFDHVGIAFAWVGAAWVGLKLVKVFFTGEE